MKKIIILLVNFFGYDIVKIKKNNSSKSHQNFIRIGNYNLLTPPNYSLLNILQRYPLYSVNLLNISVFLSSKIQNLKIIDVGANIGDTVALIKSKVNCPILCFEGTETYFNLLKKNTETIPDVFIEQLFLGDCNRTFNGEIFIIDNTAEIGFNKNGDNIKLVTLDYYLKLESLFSKAKLLKIDTDGFDIKIINGSWDYINSAKPVIFFEYDYDLFSKNNENGIDLFDKFNNNGYENALIYDNFGRLLLQVYTKDNATIRFLTNYIKDKKQSAIPYFDIIVYHKSDNKMLIEFIENETAFQVNL